MTRGNPNQKPERLLTNNRHRISPFGHGRRSSALQGQRPCGAVGVSNGVISRLPRLRSSPSPAPDIAPGWRNGRSSGAIRPPQTCTRTLEDYQDCHTEFMTRDLLRRVRRSRLAGNTMIITAGNAARLGLNMLAFLLVARTMGTTEFGTFAAVLAIALITGTFAGWGANRLVIRRVARAPEEYPRALGTSLMFLLISSPPLILIATAISVFVMGSVASIWLILLVAVADIVCTTVNEIACACYQAFDRAMGTAWLNVAYSLFRVVAAIIWWLALDEHDALTWAACYFAASLAIAVFSLVSVTRNLGPPKWEIVWSDWRPGFHFAVQSAAGALLREVDKPVVANLVPLSTVGVYAAAVRLAWACNIPIQALMYSIVTRFFQLGAVSTHASLGFAKKVLPINLGAGVVMGLGLAAVSPLAPIVLGPGYADIRDVLLVFALLPVVYALYSLAADFLVGVDAGVARSIVQVAILPVEVLLCLWLVPKYGAVGAAAAAVLTHVVAALASWAAVIYLVKRAPRKPSEASDIKT